MNARGVIGTTPAAEVNVTANVHRLVEGTGTSPISGTRGPTVVTVTAPRASSTRTVSPWTASQGWAALASSTRPTGTLALGNQLGTPPYSLDEPLGRLTTMAVTIKATLTSASPAAHRCAFKRDPSPVDTGAGRAGRGGRFGCGPPEPSGGSGLGRMARSRACRLELTSRWRNSLLVQLFSGLALPRVGGGRGGRHHPKPGR